MPERDPTSPWRIPLVREIAVILMLKLTLLLGIKAIWFTEPTVPRDGQQRVENHLLGQPSAPSSTSTEETPR
ncbi:cytochrome oxidase putative small subunit CydP [Ectopseudomonas oleovorans]|uniref:cytochrome oxidase putative small subunit CydP n=1 Tax=Ectopseudomonas oleovorans TaxID=301 RepID=UPI0024204261|nr:cytochrome oxidase putative small subunit CydP [Pseudomonas oleovorans]